MKYKYKYSNVSTHNHVLKYKYQCTWPSPARKYYKFKCEYYSRANNNWFNVMEKHLPSVIKNYAATQQITKT